MCSVVPERVVRRMVESLGIGESEARSLFMQPRRMTSGARIERSAVVEKRKHDDESMPVASMLGSRGFAAVFDEPSERLYGFLVERIKRGAFKDVLKSRDLDSVYLVNHEGLPFARTSNNTLRLAEKPEGLWHEADFNELDSEAVSLDAKIARGDVNQMSFAFTILRDEWRYCECVEDPDYRSCDCTWERDVQRVASLDDVSVVTYPAYPQTSVEVARDSESGGERSAQAVDTEQREDSGPDSATSQGVAGDTATAIRLWVEATTGVTNESGNQGGAKARLG